MTQFDPRALQVLTRLRRAGHRAVLVGGCVRDGLLGLVPHDYDAATSALPGEICSACSDLRCVETGIAHGTVTVLCDGLPVEVTTFRRESTYSDHRHPDQVAFTSSLEEDLKRRDFTINAMAWDTEGLIDLFGGREDLRRRQVRCVGSPELRFREDALRLLRGLRLAAQLDFSLHPDTAAATRRTLPQLTHVAWERISAEFVRLLCSPASGRILLEFPDAAAQVIPELAPCVGFAQRNPHHRYDVYTHSVRTLEAVSPTPVLRLAALLHDVGKPSSFTLDAQGVGHFYGHPKISAHLAEQALLRLRLDSAARERILLLVARHDLPVEPTRQWVGRWLSRLGEEAFFQLMELKAADGLACGTPADGREKARRQAEILARQVLSERPCLTLRHLAVNGRDAMAAGLEGPEIGRALRSLLEQTAEGTLPNDRALLLCKLNQLAQPR